MHHGIFIAAAVALVTLLTGCTSQQYGYGYGPGYYEQNPGSYSYRYRPFYTPGYHSYYDTSQTAGTGGAS